MSTPADISPDSTTGKPLRPRRRAPPSICFFAVIFASVSGGSFALWTHVIAPAREAARRSQCENNLFQHSGWHPCAFVSLGQDEKVFAVGCCPLCYTSEAPIGFRGPGGAVLDEAGLRPETVDEARKRILIYQSEPRYRRLRVGFGRDEAAAEKWASTEWERFKVLQPQ